jgi:hypothetical protein
LACNIVVFSNTLSGGILPSDSDFERVRKIVFDDAAVRDRLLAQTDLEPFLSLVVAVARERGLALTEAEVLEEHKSAVRAWMMRQVR